MVTRVNISSILVVLIFRKIVMYYDDSIKVYIGTISPAIEVISKALIIARDIRMKNISVEVNTLDTKIKNKISAANKRSAFFFIPLGEKELDTDIVLVKDLDSRYECEVFTKSLPDYLYNCFHSIYYWP